MNPAGFTYAGFALKDCIKGAALPYVEVHISSIAKRNIHCVLSDVAEGVITGFGMYSYILGLDAMLEILRKKTNDEDRVRQPHLRIDATVLSTVGSNPQSRVTRPRFPVAMTKAKLPAGSAVASRRVQPT
jgi:hypothetical protein